MSHQNQWIFSLDEWWRSRIGSSATSIVVPFGPTNAPHSKIFELTYGELAGLVNSLSNKLRSEYNINKGDVVSTYYENGLPAILGFLSVTSMGAVCAPLNPAYRKAALEFYFKDTNPTLILIPDDADSPLIQECVNTAKAKRIRVLRLDVNYESGNVVLNGKRLTAVNPKMTLDSPAPNKDDVALILHTSGTTSQPKGVPLTHGNITKSVCNIITHYGLISEDVCQIVMPLFHVHGLIGCLLSTLNSGGTCVVPPHKFSATKFWKTMCFCKCSWYSAVPSIHQILLKNVEKDYVQGLTADQRDHMQRRWRFTRSCSAALPAAVLERLEQVFQKPMLEAYAMTEASHQMCANPLPENSAHKPGSVGIPTGVEVVILDNEENRILPNVGDIGEISIYGPNVTKGYLNRPDANAKCFSRISGNPDKIYFRTGDQGTFDKDGYLFLTGRLKEMINRGGEKIAPLEIDDILLQHKNVAVAVAFGVPHGILGEAVNAAVVPVNPSVDKDTLKRELFELCQQKMAKFKIPDVIYIADDVPRTATGKIQRRIVAEHFVNKSKI